MTRKSPWIWVPALASLLSLAGCVIAPAHPHHSPPPGPVVVAPAPGVVAPAIVVTPVAPPAQLQEGVVAAPGPGHVWIAGYWTWVGQRYVWTHGHWAPLRHGHRWIPRTWHHGHGGWQQHGGHWAR